MAANGLLENPALFSGYLKTPKQCVLNWLEIENEENLSFEYFHQILVFMLRLEGGNFLKIFLKHASDFCSMLQMFHKT